jgi:hypothetical protein
MDAVLLAADADKDSFAEIVTLINSVDTENDEAFAGYVSSNNTAVAALVAQDTKHDSQLADLDTLIADKVEDLEGEIEASSKAADEARKELGEDLSQEITDNKTESDDADAAIIAAVGYDERGPASDQKFNDYTKAFDEYNVIANNKTQVEAHLADAEAIAEGLEADGAPQAEIDKAEDEVEAIQAELEKVSQELKDADMAEFSPSNEVNFIAWADKKSADELSEELQNVDDSIFASREDSEKADAAIIAAVGYEDRGAASDQKFNEYSQEVTEAIEEDGESPFGPINEVNFEAWKNAKLTEDLDSEIKRAEAAENGLDDKISDIISNTDVTSLDSFSEVEAGVNAGFVSLKEMILAVAGESIEQNFGAVEADGTQVLFAGYPTPRPKPFVNGLLQEEGVDYSYSVSTDGKGNKVADITFTSAPVAGARVMVLGVDSTHNAEDRYETPVVFEGEES